MGEPQERIEPPTCALLRRCHDKGREFEGFIYTQTIHRNMGFKTISLSDSVYRRLRAEKRSGESFSDVIARLLETDQPPLMKYAGAWKPLSKAELGEIRARIDRLRHGTPAH